MHDMLNNLPNYTNSHIWQDLINQKAKKKHYL